MKTKMTHRMWADRLCYLDKGMEGLRYRTGMIRADKDYFDEYDRKALNMFFIGELV